MRERLHAKNYLGIYARPDAPCVQWNRRVQIGFSSVIMIIYVSGGYLIVVIDITKSSYYREMCG